MVIHWYRWCQYLKLLQTFPPSAQTVLEERAIGLQKAFYISILMLQKQMANNTCDDCCKNKSE